MPHREPCLSRCRRATSSPVRPSRNGRRHVTYRPGGQPARVIVYGDPSFEADSAAVFAVVCDRIAKLLQLPAPGGGDDVRLALTAAGQVEQALEDAIAAGGAA